MYNKLNKTIIFLSLGFLSYQSSYAQCPNLKSLVIGDTVCSNSASASISIQDTKIGVGYQAILGTTPVGDPVFSTAEGSSVELNIPVSALSFGENDLMIAVVKVGCGPVVLSNKANIVVNQLPSSSLKMIGDTICAGSGSAMIKIEGTKLGEQYQLFEGTVAIGAPITSNSGDIFISIPATSFNVGINTITATASIAGCANVNLANQAVVLVNPIPMTSSFTLTGDTICSSNPNAKITIFPTSKSSQYQIYKEDTFIDSFYGDSTNNFTVKNIPTSLLTIGENIIKVNTSFDMGECGGITSLQLSTKILVHPALGAPKLKLTGDTVYISDKFATVKIENSPIGLAYNISQSQLPDTNVVAIGNTLELKIPIGGANGLPIGNHKIYLNAEIAGCNKVTIRDSIYVLVMSDLTASIENDFNSNDFMVWPNPFQSELHFSSKGNMKVQIVDALGNKVHQQTISASEELKINPYLKSGLYFLQIENEGKIELVKLIKQ